ncbi:MAG: DUF1858 domain-containing protein [Candidatus ainarchaeum sp.]|nr:DUF1858 domain-containing protein [Candidatus ainarchaeum sp.]
MKNKKFKITKDSKISEILENYPECYELLLELGLPCMGCPASRLETIEQGCAVHGIDVNQFLEKLEKRCKSGKL